MRGDGEQNEQAADTSRAPTMRDLETGQESREPRKMQFLMTNSLALLKNRVELSLSWRDNGYPIFKLCHYLGILAYFCLIAHKSGI
jgi:hypothetical protein